MRKEFFILMTVVGVCEEIYVLSHPQDNLRLILPTMECENYLYASNVCQNRAKHTLVTNYSSDRQTQSTLYNEIRRDRVVNRAGETDLASCSACIPGMPFGLHFLSVHKLQEFAKATPCSRLLNSNLRMPYTSLQVLETLLVPILFLTFLYIFIRGNIFTEHSTSSNILLYFEFSVMLPTLVPVRAALSPTSAQFPSLSAAATPSFNFSSMSFSTNYSTSHNLLSTLPSDVIRTRSNIEPSTASFTFKSLTTDTSVPSAKQTVSHWYKQGPCRSTFVYFSNNCYKFYKEPLVFNRAARLCKDTHSNITSVLSREENTFIHNLTGYVTGQSGNIRIWLGLERLISSGKLHWIDNNVLLYQNFELGEPNGDGACVQMTEEGKWRDTSCDKPLRFVCKAAPSAPPPFTRSVELIVMVGIPLICATIMLTVVSILVMRSIKEAEGTAMGFGETTDKETVQTSLVNVTASIAHVSTQGCSSDSRTSISSGSKTASHYSSPCQSPVARPNGRTLPENNTTVDLGTLEMVQPEEEREVEQHEMVIFRSNTSLASAPSTSRFQSTTSLDHLVAKSYIKPKTRRLRSLRKAEGVVSPAGKEGKYVKKMT